MGDFIMEIILSNLPENLEVDEKLSDTVKEAVEKVGQLYALDNAEVSITLTDNEHIHEINREYRKVDRPTDVISFALNEGDEPNIEGEIPVNMLGDIIIAEPGALIGFAGPRVIEQTIGQKLPEGFQRAEFLLEHGFVDKIVERKKLRKVLVTIIRSCEYEQ